MKAATAILDIQRESKKLRSRNAADSKRALKVAARHAKNLFRQSRKSKKSGATKGAGSYSKIGKAIALLVKKHAGSKRADPYSQDQDGASFVSTNALGLTSNERAAEWRLEELKHPGVQPDRLINHISISRPAGHELDLKVWVDSVVPTFLEEAGIKGLYVATLHTSTKNQHIHLVYSRSQPDGCLLTDSMDFLTLMRAAKRTAERLNIQVSDIVPTQAQAPCDRAVKAKRRAERLGTNPKVWIEPAVVQECLYSVKTFEDFARRLARKGVEVKKSVRSKDGQVTGILFKNSDADQWLAGSTISRELTLPKLMAGFELNAQRSNAVAPQRPPAPIPSMRPAPFIQTPRQRGG